MDIKESIPLLLHVETTIKTLEQKTTKNDTSLRKIRLVLTFRSVR